MEFESQIGDLASVIKVEKRRSAVIEKLQKNNSETSWLVDRYKFLHLMPCTAEELKSIGYTNNNTNSHHFIHSNDSSANLQTKISNENNTSKSKIPLPNLTQLVPFKPMQNPGLVSKFFVVVVVTMFKCNI